MLYQLELRLNNMLTYAQTLALDTNCKIVERPIKDPNSGDEFVGLTVKDRAFKANLGALWPTPTIDQRDLECVMQQSEAVDELHFIPYYFRANRCGRGQMRVGLRAM